MSFADFTICNISRKPTSVVTKINQAMKHGLPIPSSPNTEQWLAPPSSLRKTVRARPRRPYLQLATKRRRSCPYNSLFADGFETAHATRDSRAVVVTAVYQTQYLRLPPRHGYSPHRERSTYTLWTLSSSQESRASPSVPRCCLLLPPNPYSRRRRI